MFLNLPQGPFARSLSRSPDGSNISEVTLCSPYSPSGDVLGSILKLESFNEIDKKKFNFFVSPSTISEIVTKMPQNYIPGAETISEFNYLYNLGYKVIKFFPATLNDGCKKLKSIETIYKDLYFMPTGGINKKNMNDFLDLNNVICVGMTNV